MTRGKKEGIMANNLNWLRKASVLAIYIASTFPSDALALSAGRAVKDDTAKVAAPTKEDSADYFAASRKGVSKEDAKKADDLRGKTIDQIKNYRIIASIFPGIGHMVCKIPYEIGEIHRFLLLR